ncbi:putative plastidic glucose transporter 3 [Cocos nucifera]|uniref:Putative plastidic glucose transporter 3 n=1 Tax=Cocos nucifera TaxID=13894 RepID=A0A8K0I3U3_COCNU|nr:putative plastidic glucose transporter 3 [Cocos nucifera]
MRWKFNSSVHKRMQSRELAGATDRDDESPVRLSNSTGQENGSPSWKNSLPHVCVATISSFLFGYHLSVVNEPLESISMDLGFAGNVLAEGLVVSMCLGGALVGCLFSGSIADGIGRCRAFQLAALPMIAGACISASTTSLEGMLLGRFLVGTGMGVGPPVASLYVTEVSPPSVRGTYGSFIQIATCLGLIASLFIGIPVKEVMGWFSLSRMIVDLIEITVELAYAQHSLVALIYDDCVHIQGIFLRQDVRGRIGEAEVEFERLLGGPHVKSALAELSRSDKGDDAEVVFIGTTLFALQQLSGINAVFYFSSTVFKNAGVPSDIANLCVGFANLSGSIVAMLLMDKLGRKVLLFGSFLGMAAAMGLQASAASFHHLGSGRLYLSVGGMLLFVLAFSLGAGPVPGLLLPEIFPNRIRAKAMALCMSVHWVVNFFVGLLFLQMLEQLGPQVLYSIFASFCLIAAIFVRRNVVETKGKSLQEIEIALLPPERIHAKCKMPSFHLHAIAAVISELIQFVGVIENMMNAGYVAEIRKKDPKICWPFPMFHGQTSDKHISLFPPLPVTKFRRWNCQNCWHKAVNCAATRASEAPDIQNALVKRGTVFLGNTFMTLANGKGMLPGSHQLSKEKIVDGGLTEAGCSVVVPNGECCPSANCDNNTKNNLTDLQVAKASQGSYEGIQNPSSDKLAYVETKDEACHMGGRGGRNVASTANTLEALYCEDMVNAKSKETEIVDRSTDFSMVISPACIDFMVHGKKDEQLIGKMGMTKQQFSKAARETEAPLEKNIAMPQVDSQTAVAAHLSELDSKGLDENDDETSDNNATSPQDTVQSRIAAMQVGFSDGNLQHKKGRKMRLLDEIMRTDELDSSGKIDISDGGEDANQIEDRIDRRPPTLSRKDSELGAEIHHTSHRKTKVKSFKGKRRYIDFENLDDGSSLMYWIKKARKEGKTKRRYKHIDAEAAASAENGLVNSLKVCTAKKHKQNAIGMQSAMHQGCLMPQQENTTNKDIFIADGKATKQVNDKNIRSKLKRTVKAGRSLLHHPDTCSNACEKVTLRKKKKKKHHINNEESGKTGLPKGRKKVIKERETTQTCEQEALNDIPMDIVELLAKNRQLMNAKAAMVNTHCILESTEIMEDNHVLDVNEGHGDKVPGALHENSSQQKSVWNNTGNSVWTAVRSDKNADESMKLLDYATTHGRKNNHINLNQKEFVSASTGFISPLQCRGHPNLPMTDSKKNWHSQHHSWSKMEMQTSESCHKGQEILGQNTFRNALGELSMPLSRTPFGINSEKVSADYSPMNMFGPDTLLHEKPMTVALNIDYLKTMDQAKIHLQKRQESAEFSVHNRSFPAVTSFAELGNTSNSEMVRPQDLYTNESIPAMHLLRLMDSAKWSGMSLQDLPNTNHIGSPWESDLSSTGQCEKEMIGLGPRGKSNQAANPPLVVQHPNQVQHQEISCKPYRPLPRVGVYGSLLQKEITSPLDDSGTFRIGYSSKITTLEASRKDNSELSYSASKAGVLNAQVPISRNENSESPFSVVNSNVHRGWYSVRNDITGVGISSKGATVEPLNNHCEKEICVINRNPADFTIVDQDNEYMIESDNIWPRPTTPTVNLSSGLHPNGQRRQKVRRVAALNGLMRS